MSETRYRANLLASTVDAIQIVNENDQFVDVRYDRGYGITGQAIPGPSIIRREAKVTAYSQVCKTKADAWQAIQRYALDQAIAAEQAVLKWSNAAHYAMLEVESAKQSD